MGSVQYWNQCNALEQCMNDISFITLSGVCQPKCFTGDHCHIMFNQGVYDCSPIFIRQISAANNPTSQSLCTAPDSPHSATNLGNGGNTTHLLPIGYFLDNSYASFLLRPCTIAMIDRLWCCLLSVWLKWAKLPLKGNPGSTQDRKPCASWHSGLAPRFYTFEVPT